MSIWTRIRHSTILSFILIITVLGAVGGATLFSQTIPAGPTTVSAVASLSSTCTLTGLVGNTTGTVKAGSVIVYGCGSTGTPAFSSTAGTITPVFTLGTGYNGLAIASAANCTAMSSLSSGTPVTLSALSYWYCASTSTTPGALASFTVNWQ